MEEYEHTPEQFEQYRVICLWRYFTDASGDKPGDPVTLDRVKLFGQFIEMMFCGPPEAQAEMQRVLDDADACLNGDCRHTSH